MLASGTVSLEKSTNSWTDPLLYSVYKATPTKLDSDLDGKQTQLPGKGTHVISYSAGAVHAGGGRWVDDDHLMICSLHCKLPQGF